MKLIYIESNHGVKSLPSLVLSTLTARLLLTNGSRGQDGHTINPVQALR